MWTDTNDGGFNNNSFSSPGGPKQEAKKLYPKHLVPVTAHIIKNCTQVENEASIYEYEHLKFHQICFLGIIRNVIKRANDITYLVDDMTSSEIQVKLAAEDGDDMESEETASSSRTEFMENQYVKIHGSIKTLQGLKIVQALSIRPLKELNELSHHLLECMNTSIYYSTKGSGEQQFNASAGNRTNTGTTAGLTGIHQKLANWIKQSIEEAGVHLSDIYRAFSDTPQQKLREALEFLSTEGHVYSTVDDEHFRSTEHA